MCTSLNDPTSTQTPVARTSDRARGSQLRVLTLNLWGRAGDWASRRAVLQRGLRELSADLIAFLPAWPTVVGRRERLLPRRLGQHAPSRSRAHIHPAQPARNGGERSPQEVSRRIDDVFVRGDEYGPTLEIAACALAFAEPIDGVWASDHIGVVADLAVPT
jgi:hypothetical protein